ncbi:NADPH-dependent F420 reductase [Microbacterium tenebrionis]|uniref:NADPH-dependent F420 reductase n=1 Tax=Microbacterium tenebrionis TaxID=2830665 RepID=UPI00158E7BC9|nr:NAD(P)-binding domain-containing protein [Microbacterium ihumii]
MRSAARIRPASCSTRSTSPTSTRSSRRGNGKRLRPGPNRCRAGDADRPYDDRVTAARSIKTLGILGAGRLGSMLARLAASAGLRVLVARSGDPAVISGRMRALGAIAASSETVIAESDAVVLALPLGRYRLLPADALRGRLVIDAMNYWWASDGIRDDLSDPRTSTSELVQEHLAGARVVKALSHMGYEDLEDEARPAGTAGRKAIAVAGGSAADVAVVSALIDTLGFDAVHAGPLAAGIMLEPGSELFGADVDADQLRAMLDGFWDSQRGIVVRRAREAAGA